MFITRNTIMDPAAVAAGVLVVYIFLCIFLKLIINSSILLVRQPYHNCKRIVFGKNIAHKLVFLFMSNPPAIIITVRENNLLLCIK